MKTQKQWAIEQLKEFGEVSRNGALKNYISRLGSIVCNLRKEGWELDTSRREGDYVYKLIAKPKRMVWEHDIVDGVAVPRLTEVDV